MLCHSERKEESRIDAAVYTGMFRSLNLTRPFHGMTSIDLANPNVKVEKTFGADAGSWPCIGVLLMRARPRL